ncbi:MAG: tetratricopeptide repeat protein [Candidatus Edwardsbacteria bacterium]|nr:tetratricopeptide repeat protein [Candidatus Edwardsbacteria bacterium]MBU1576440.1 tetratricopeptide repeat protein [Candidatus Edwardsbacteria bacterium]MBU2464057.1 tetratricopeptide repeat protein [Candidatus Edwardsbacteria bacterium]MBU2594513.1 tetratricopeptide repeat protein [Candidatus Edwardsbacteria bacterium]
MAEINRLKEQARAFYQKAEWEKAKRAAEQIVSIEPEDSEFNLTLANIYLELGEGRKGLDMYEKALRLSEKSGDFSRVIAASKKILSIDKDRIELYNKIAEGYLNLGLKSGAVREWVRYANQMKIRSDFTAMAAVYQRITDIIPENPPLKAGYQKIRQLADQAVSDNSENAPEPADIVPYRRLVDVALKMGQARKIIETQQSYARVLQRRGFVRKARAVYQKILERDPGNEEALAKVLSSSEDSALDDKKLQSELLEACKNYQELIWNKIDEAYEPYYDLGILFRQEGLKDEAIVEFQNSIKGGNRQLKGFEMLAVSFLEQGDYGLAKEVLSQGLSIRKFLDNEYVGLHYNLGVAHEQLGDSQKALYEYEQVYVIDITYKDVAKRLRDLENKFKDPQQTRITLPEQEAAAGPGSGIEPGSLEPASEEAPRQIVAVDEIIERIPAEALPAGDEEFYPKAAVITLSENTSDDRYAPLDENDDVSYQQANLPIEETASETETETEPPPETAPIVLSQKDKGLSFL